jgi:hypothetical protein
VTKPKADDIFRVALLLVLLATIAIVVVFDR